MSLWIKKVLVVMGAMVGLLLLASVVFVWMGGLNFRCKRHLKGSTDWRTVASAAEMYMAETADKCPTVQDLYDARILSGPSTDYPAVDRWGTTWQILCDADGPCVRGAGRDRRFGTDDDVPTCYDADVNVEPAL